MNTQLKSILAKKLAKKGRKLNGFTLIELMVVVAIVGVLTAVGLPQLTKAQDTAKDRAAEATLTNAAKECSLDLITDADPVTTFATYGGKITGTCDGTPLKITSNSTDKPTFVVAFDGDVPRPPELDGDAGGGNPPEGEAPLADGGGGDNGVGS